MIGNLYKFFFYLTKSQVGKNSFLSVAQTLIGMVCMFAAYKMLVFFVGIKQLGLWALLISGVSFARLADFTGASSLGRFVAGFELSDSKASVFIETVLLSTTFINIVACAILWVFSDLIIFHFFKEFNVENIKFLIPFALISSVLLPSISLALSSALDGTQRSDRRSMLTIASYIFFLINVFILVPRYGILGYGISQINQQVFLIIVLWAALKHHFQELSLIPCHFSREAFLSSFDFGLKVQLNSLAAYLSEPLAKFMLAAYGGVTMVGFYELASKLVFQLRAIFVSAMQPLMPAYVKLIGKESQQLKLKLSATRFAILSGVAVVIISLIFAPTFIKLMLGGKENQLYLIIVGLAFGAAINLFSVPMYFFAIGRGIMKWNILSQIWMALSIILSGLVFGNTFGSTAVIFGIALGLIGNGLIASLGNSYSLDCMKVYMSLSKEIAIGLVIISTVCIISVLGIL